MGETTTTLEGDNEINLRQESTAKRQLFFFLFVCSLFIALCIAPFIIVFILLTSSGM